MTIPAVRSPRADSQRNRALIIDATLRCLAVDPRASMTQIAHAAGVGRVTLYGHFASRRELIDAAAHQTMTRVEAELSPLALDGDPLEALLLLASASWRLLDGVEGLVAAAEQELGSDRIREHHDQTLHRVRDLIERGQADNACRADQSASWLTACYFAILHGAAAEVRAGRLSDMEAATAIPKTLRALVSAAGTQE
ncbi:TetR/AcrR family transcriptional regulator [Cryobacterium melibiosiphilum]|uniref:TetR/AcrR family transcriptional regulator n=1 Tax=Cryobacterium melibiosiphilum TaxID=995039 RepID=A0A3A5MHR5_9MICO|nr:TetR/AcrR family transcriptional regulator [Cryobacterium melibiosiphilum]RJT85652.1 TetR/AcrR family transcriptional regulator [Cryobacterium melibiosiphilum]